MLFSMGVIEPRSTTTAVLPEQFGKYSLLGHLATGGMAEVWLARQSGMQGFEKIVVIKRARPELTDHGTTRLFLEEARLVATLEHPNIAQVYEIGAVNNSATGGDICGAGRNGKGHHGNEGKGNSSHMIGKGFNRHQLIRLVR